MRKAPNGTPVVVQTGASIIVEDSQGRILMQQRSDDGTWSYPGGRIEIDETVEDGARREVFEECGLKVGKLELLGVFSGRELNHIYPNGNEVCGVDIVFISSDYSGQLSSLDQEAKAMGFFPIDDLPQPISAMNAKQLNAYLVHRKRLEPPKGLYGALEAGGTKMVCAICDEKGQVLTRASIPTRNPEQTVPKMIEFFQKYDILALGIGCFGPIDLDRNSPTYGYITTTPKLEWQNYPIVRTFEEALGIPVGFDTDVNASALGEATWGSCQGIDNCLYITVGTGIGVGVIAGGKPYHGLMHPEGGHILLNRHPEDPMHGSRCPFHDNCLEGLAAGPAIEKRWGKKAELLSQNEKVWELEAWYLAQAVCNYILMFSPQRIVLGGGVSHQRGLLEKVREQVRLHVNGYIQNSCMEDLEHFLMPPSLNDNQGVMGCAKLAMNALREKA